MARLSGRLRVLSEWEQGGYDMRLVGRKQGMENQIERLEVFVYGAWFPAEAVIDT